MRRLAFLLVLLTALAAAQEKRAITFRLKKDPLAPMRGWMLDHNEEGFRFARFGDGPRAFVRWDELVDEDASAMRQELGLELTPDEKMGIVDGHELFFRGGGSVLGRLERRDVEGQRYWFRTGGMVLPYPEDRVDRIEEARVRESEIFSEEEVYIRRLEREPPETAPEHVALADYMYDIGDWEASERHYGRAIDLDRTLAATLQGRIAEIRELLADREASQVFRKAKSVANLQGDYDTALRLVETYVTEHPEAKRGGAKVMDTILERRQQKLEVAFYRSKHEAFEYVVRRYLARQKPDLATAMDWARSRLAAEIEALVRRRMNFDEENYAAFLQAGRKGTPHFASYWSGTFAISKRAKVGQPSKREVRGNPEAWWAQYEDVLTRSSWLQAYAAERLPDLFEIVQVRNTACERCGGRGVVTKTSLTGVKAIGGRHEWNETCPRCFGAREDRGIAYR